MSSITLEDIHKTFGDKKILNGISLKIEDGELVSLLGPSGCGKSTILNIISGLLPEDSGHILFGEMPMNHIAVEKRGAALVDQDILLFPHMTVAQNIGFGLKMAHAAPVKIKNTTEELISLIHLEGHEKKYPNQLSGGQQQRVAIARALAIKPRVVLLDEPFSRLDVSLRENMRNFVKELHREIETTIILVSHDIEETLYMSDRICILLDGEIQQYDTPRQVYYNPANRKVAEFLGQKNFLRGQISNSIFKTALGSFPINKMNLLNNSKVSALIRPDQVKLVPQERSNIKGVFRDMNLAAGMMHFTIEIDDTTIQGSTTDFPDVLEGDSVHVYIDFTKTVFFPEKIL